MKKLVFVLFAFVLFSPLAYAQDHGNSEDSNSSSVAKITFEKGEHPFGDIKQGDKVETIFTFENTGSAPLVLTNVSTTCGCTAPEWPREAIQPGDKGEIKIQFNSTGKVGAQNKVITVYSNATNNPERIKITANVLKP